MADPHLPVECCERPIVEDGGDEAHVLHDGEVSAVARGDAGRFLAPVLEGEDAQVAEVGDRLVGGVHPEHPTGLAWLATVGLVAF